MTVDPFSVLGVDAGVSEPELTAAYRRLAKRWHPDRLRPEAAEAIAAGLARGSAPA